MNKKDEIVTEIIESSLPDKDVLKIAEACVFHTRCEAAYIAESIYIDCEPEQQATVDMVQQLIAERIMSELS